AQGDLPVDERIDRVRLRSLRLVPPDGVVLLLRMLRVAEEARGVGAADDRSQTIGLVVDQVVVLLAGLVQKELERLAAAGAVLVNQRGLRVTAKDAVARVRGLDRAQAQAMIVAQGAEPPAATTAHRRLARPEAGDGARAPAALGSHRGLLDRTGGHAVLVDEAVP